MKRLEFRAWIPEAKMLYDKGMYYQEDQYLSSFLRRIYDQYLVTHPSYLDFEMEERLMQHVFLKDRNGNKIFEGDICEYNSPVDGKRYNTIIPTLDNSHWFGELNGGEDFVILGNKHENPELNTNLIK